MSRSGFIIMITRSGPLTQTRDFRTATVTQAVLALIIGLGAMAPSLAAAQDEPRHAAAAKLEKIVHKYLGLYVMAPERRDPSERVTFDGRTLTVDYRWSKKDETQSVVCLGGRWLLVGRLKSALGARALFNDLTRVERLILRLIDVTTSVKPIGDGKYKQRRHESVIARFEVGRENAAKLDPKVLSQTLTGQRCPRFVRSLLDSVSFPEARRAR